MIYTLNYLICDFLLKVAISFKFQLDHDPNTCANIFILIREIFLSFSLIITTFFSLKFQYKIPIHFIISQVNGIWKRIILYFYIVLVFLYKGFSYIPKPKLFWQSEENPEMKKKIGFQYNVI